MKIKTAIGIMIFASFISSLLLGYVFHNSWFFLILLTNLPLLIRQKFFLCLERLLLVILLSVSLKLIVSTFFKVEASKQLFWEIGSLSFYVGYLVYALQISYSKNFKESFVQTAEEKADDSGWACPKCKAKMLFSMVCWNCQTPKPGTSQEIASESREEKDSQEASKLDSYLQKQKKEAEKRNGQI